MSQNPTKHTKVLIIGSGPAGYTAAVYAARAMLNPILVYGSEPGGQLTTTTDVENFPGFADVIQGPWLMDQMKEQAKAVGTEMIEDHISSVDLKKTPFEAIGDTGQKYTADSIIISTGAQARWLNLKSEQEFRGFGVSACATCDGFFFKDKEVAVVGGGNAAVEEAMFLTKFASKVKLIHRRDNLRAEKMLQKKLMDNKKIEIIWDSVVEDVIGDKDPKNVKGKKMIFFRQKLEEVITLPPPPKDDVKEALQVRDIVNVRTPEQVQSVRDHDQDPYFAIKRVIKKYKLEFHENELEQIIKESVPVITHFKNFFNRKRPHVVLPSINTLPSETNKTPAYPSGHACQSVIIARYVAGKEPRAERELMKAAYECGYGRVIAGFHYVSDFDIGNLLGEKMYVMMSKADFGAEMAEDTARGIRIKYKDLSETLKKLV